MRSALAMSWLALCLVLGCTAPEGRFACTTAADCPSGWVCRADGRCWSSPGGDGVDASSDASLDVGTDAAADTGIDALAANDTGPVPDGGQDASAAIDAFTPLDAFTPADAFVPPVDAGRDAFVPPVDAGRDAFVPPVDAGRDAFVPPVDAFVPPDAFHACSDTTSDPFNCGSCGVVCPAPPTHGSATCSSSTCGATCDAGYLRVNGTHPYCTRFGGAYLLDNAATPPSCLDGNAFSSGCTCPPGFNDFDAGQWIAIGGTPARLHFCLAPGTTTDGAWGGLFVRHDTGCFNGNPLASDGCSCPAGTTGASEWSGRTSSQAATVVFCTGTVDPGGTFSGAFTQTNSTTTCGFTCVTPGTCSCGSDRGAQFQGRAQGTAICDAESTLCYPP